MALPAPNDPCWKKLAEGAPARLRTEHLGTQLMTKRVERSKDSTQVKAAEILAFFAKWERILANEIQQLPRL